MRKSSGDLRLSLQTDETRSITVAVQHCGRSFAGRQPFGAWMPQGPSTSSFDHRVGEREQASRYPDPETPRRLTIDHELGFSRPQHPQVGRLLTVENAADPNPGQALLVDEVRSIARKPADLAKGALGKNRRQTVVRREPGHVHVPVLEEQIL